MPARPGHPRTQHFPPPPFPRGNRTARRIKAEADLFSVIGIDLGSSSTRTVLRCLDDGRYVHIDGKANPNNVLRYSSGDFASSGYPLEKSNGPYYVPNHEQDEGEPRHGMSLKYGMYVLANASTAEGLRLDLLQQYPLVQEIMATLKDDADFPARLRQDLVGLFSEIRGRIYTFCARAGLRITRIGLTIPVQWTLEFEAGKVEEQEPVRSTRSRRRYVPRAYGRGVAVPLSNAAKKRKRMMAYEVEDEDEE